jgi:DNA-binding transcriptional MocR family regulator
VPTIQNPTALTMSSARRQAIYETACRHNVPIVEDDPYWLLAGDAPPPIATLQTQAKGVPVFYISTLSKCLAPGLRTAYLVMPRFEPMEPVLDALRATTLMGSQCMASLATHWVRSGQGLEFLRKIRVELGQRQKLALELLPPDVRAHPNGLHLWLPLPSDLDQYRLIQTASEQGLGVANSDAFSTQEAAPNAIRLSLGGAVDQASLAIALKKLASIIAAGASPRHKPVVV